MVWQTMAGLLLGFVLGSGLLNLCFLPSLAQPAATAGLEPKYQNAEAAETAFLERWVGEWEGTGTSEGQAVRDRMTFQWTLDRRFLRFTYKALSGDRYESEGYVWSNPKLKRYEWWEFNNGIWAVRQHTGYRHKDQLVLEEDTGDRKLRLTFTFSDNNTLAMTEAFVNGEQTKPYVVMQFCRQRGKT